MSSVVLTVGTGHTLREAARRMADKKVGAAVVLDEDAPGPGILSERDLLLSIGRGEDPDKELVGDHMSDSPITAAPGRVRIQASAMLPATPQRTADRRRAAPAPITEPEMTCVVDSG